MNTHLQQLQTLSVKAVKKIDYELADELSAIHDSFNQIISRSPLFIQEYFTDCMCDVLITFTHNILAMVKKL